MLGILKDSMRRLTADYTEEEYREYLEESVCDYLKDIPKGKNIFEVPEVKGTESNKDIACLLSDVAQETGYEDSFLWDQFVESVKDLMDLGETFFEARKAAFESVATISYEQDW